MARKTRGWDAGKAWSAGKVKVWTAGKIVVLAGALVATYVISAAGSMRLALKAREVEVPNLTSQTANDASGIAVGAGLTLKVDSVRRPDPKIPEGRVLAQDPPAGTTTRRARSVRVWLSAGSRAETLPPLVGETERAAALRASQNGITVDTVAEIRSPDYAADVIVAQTPPARTPSDRVALLINRGAEGESYVMPDLIGVNGDRAAEILRAHGFRVAVVASNPYPGVAAGIILRQNPQGGFRIAPGEPVSLEVSR